MSRLLPRRRRPRTVLGVLGALTLVSLAACTSDGTEERDPADALSAAADRLSATSGVRLELLTDDLPSGISGLTGAEGVASGDAFEGELSVRISMATFEVPVVSLDDTVWAVLPGTKSWADVDPAEYGAPDPAGLVSTEGGFAMVLSATEDAQAEGQERSEQDTSEVLHRYSGTVPGERMKEVIPSSSGDEFEATYLITEDDELRSAQFTGVFYPDSEEMTYELRLSDYDTEAEITVPEGAR